MDCSLDSLPIEGRIEVIVPALSALFALSVDVLGVLLVQLTSDLTPFILLVALLAFSAGGWVIRWQALPVPAILLDDRD